MSKRELINAILQHNRSAAPEFLAKFEESDLKAYLDRVCVLSTKPNYPMNSMLKMSAGAR